METNIKEQKQKKRFWGAIWESMTKTGGCCGSGGNCCGAPKADDKQKVPPTKNAPATCCSK